MAGRAQPDVLAQRALARQRRGAWESGRTRVPAPRPGQDERDSDTVGTAGTRVAPWDTRRGRAQALGADEEDPHDRGPGLARGRDRPGPTPYDPRTGTRELRRLVADRGWAGRLATAGIVAGWSSIVGDQIAGHCAIESFEAEQITVRASSSSWAQQLRLLQPSIEARIAEALRSGPAAGGTAAAGASATQRGRPPVTLRILGPAAPTWRRPGVGLRGARGPRDTYG